MSSKIIYSYHYYNRYLNFIESCKQQDLTGIYSESHHIIPRSMGGSNEKSNLVLLTARQHYIAHWMLWKAYKGKMTRAFVLMSGRVGAHKYNSKYYAKAKEELSEMMKGDGNPSSKGLTDEHKQNISKAVTGRIYSEEKKTKL